MENKKAPSWLSHKPIITVDYENKDADAGDAKFMSIGHATWDAEDYSAKIWRWAYNGERWSRQSEEIPLWRVLDLATLLVSVINQKHSSLEEFVQDDDGINSLRDYLNENMVLYAPKLQELGKMLESSTLSLSNENTPNIFSFATSELSQDAMFSWLIQWSNPEFKNSDISLYNVACSFVKLLLGQPDFSISNVRVDRQWQSIDIIAEINDNAILIIEDKTNTSIHDDQLERYKNIVKNEYKGKRDLLFFAYIKTGNEPLSTLKVIEEKGYRTISRFDIIQCLDKYTGNNILLLNYLNHLKEIENATQSFRHLPVSEWNWYAWQGFYKELETRLSLTSWDYVANPAGGFLGAWWHFTPITDGEMYLQFEERKLCFKICYEGNENRSEFRNEMHNRLLSIAKENNHDEITKPARFGAGLYMTIAVVDPEYIFGNTIVDIDALVGKLLIYQELIDLCCKQ